MIQTKEDLKRYLAADYGRTELGIKGRTLRGRLCREPYYLFWRYIRALRMEEYHTSQDGAWHKLMHYWWRRRRNLLGEKTGLWIEPGSCQEGLLVWHPNVIVPANARVGKNCTFHGNNVIGNDGGNGAAATIGDNADFGIGSSVIGRVELADFVRIGAGAVVIRSCTEAGAFLAGVPARQLSKNRSEMTT